MSKRVTERIKAREAKNTPAPTKLTYPEEVAVAEVEVEAAPKKQRTTKKK